MPVIKFQENWKLQEIYGDSDDGFSEDEQSSTSSFLLDDVIEDDVLGALHEEDEFNDSDNELVVDEFAMQVQVEKEEVHSNPPAHMVSQCMFSSLQSIFDIVREDESEEMIISHSNTDTDSNTDTEEEDDYNDRNIGNAINVDGDDEGGKMVLIDSFDINKEHQLEARILPYSLDIDRKENLLFHLNSYRKKKSGQIKKKKSLNSDIEDESEEETLPYPLDTDEDEDNSQSIPLDNCFREDPAHRNTCTVNTNTTTTTTPKNDELLPIGVRSYLLDGVLYDWCSPYPKSQAVNK